ncbi:hypothetical protein JKP88DRAFT_79185 [Tribonema minus]|uniref:JmjC domain-containing protein n=1 Tax=Tribonema minus TaxID=303371 RepID=A0A835YWS3_9STRA|nr:hypothetical protein JKP88DRAFT_79185 [Tribonema minus]
MEGEKLWTFLPPCPEHLLDGYRLPPNAWGGSYNVSAGWQSPVDLYRPFSESGAHGSDGIMLSAAAAYGVPEDVWARRKQVVQREGETVLIPPRWWHQVIHLAPSIAVASQHYAGARGRRRIFQHIRDWCGCGGSAAPPEIRSWPPQKQVEWVLQEGLCAKHGTDVGERLFKELMAGR